ncbi:MAG: type II toxin-antitoxin system HicB family antitoxin [Parcubacteria group bacterium]|nr:type II toxin-antitoxin system HicB family antitoxin [Parcubacteria group bacterium]
MSFLVSIEQDEDGAFIGTIPSIPSCYAEGRTQEEMLRNLREVVSLCLRNVKRRDVEKSRFVGIQNVFFQYA